MLGKPLNYKFKNSYVFKYIHHINWLFKFVNQLDLQNAKLMKFLNC
jgi:hypothetical protein